MSEQSDAFNLPQFFVYGAAAGFVGTIACFYIAKDVVIPRLATPSFRERVAALKTRKDRVFLYATFPSMVHALVQSFFHPMYIALGFSQEHNENRATYYDDGWPACFSGIFVGYLIADFLVVGPVDLGALYCVHHLSAAGIWTWGAGFGAMQWYACMLQFCELSTIFMNLRQWILTAGYPSGSPLELSVSILFFLSFFGVRVMPLPGLVYKWVNDFSKLSDEKGIGLALGTSTTMVIHVMLQSFWFMLMVKKIIRLVKGSGKKAKKEE